MRKCCGDQCLLLLTEFTSDYVNLEIGSINHKAKKEWNGGLETFWFKSFLIPM